ncbi:hypothetical protein GCM10020331_046100 [Ectobacillus funiculus]
MGNVTKSNVVLLYHHSRFFVIGVIYYIQKVREAGQVFLGLALALILGGAIGNFIDRVWRKEVVDFIHTYIFFLQLSGV